MQNSDLFSNYVAEMQRQSAAAMRVFNCTVMPAVSFHILQENNFTVNRSLLSRCICSSALFRESRRCSERTKESIQRLPTGRELHGSSLAHQLCNNTVRTFPLTFMGKAKEKRSACFFAAKRTLKVP